MARENRTTIILSAAIFIILEFAAFVMLSRTSTIQNIWINRASHRVMTALWSGGQNISDFFRMPAENEKLAGENSRLRATLRQYELRGEALREGEDSIRDPFRFIPASIVRMGRSTSHGYIVVNKGSDDGVRPRCGVICSDGVVGVISAVSRHYAYGISLTNSDFTIGARIGRDGFNAPLVWGGLSSTGAIMRDIPPHHELHPGDTVWTSGYSSIFPADIPIGVTGRSRLVHGSSQEVEVELFRDINSVRHVLITDNTDRDEIEDLLRGAGMDTEGRAR